MDLTPYLKHNIFTLRVIPHASHTRLIEENNRLKLYLTAVPEDSKANLQLIKFFKKEFKLNVKIISGLKSRIKVIEIY